MEQLDRAISILKNPLAELTKVKSEGINKNDIIKQYIAILALIPAIAYIIGMGIIGANAGMLGSFKYPIGTAVAGGILMYILSIVDVYVIGIVINALAPNFSSKQDENQAMKLAAYSATAGLVGGIFYIIPILSVIVLLFALYGLYILYLGIPVLMETPKEQAMGYTIVVIIVTLVVYLVVGAVTAQVMWSMSPVPGMMEIPYR
ncbi:MAG: Yip1 family protein [Candidatus Methanoperedens sp.]|nr:Yip1 family protein [Candidatus Methanoperedens sp.]